MATSIRAAKIKKFDFRKDIALSFIDSIESTWKGHELFAMWLVKKVKPKTVVDLGFDRGLSTIAFAYQNKGNVYGIDWFEEGNDYSAKCFSLDAAYRNISNAIRFEYLKDIHLIIGPFSDVSKTWKRKIDILHIDWAHSYAATKQHYENWIPFLNERGIILIHDIVAYPTETGRFFDELPLHRVRFSHSGGLGVASSDKEIIEKIQKQYNLKAVS